MADEVNEPEFERILHEELEQRIGEISGYSSHTFGVIGTGELLLATAVCVVLPIALVWGFR